MLIEILTAISKRELEEQLNFLNDSLIIRYFPTKKKLIIEQDTITIIFVTC